MRMKPTWTLAVVAMSALALLAGCSNSSTSSGASKTSGGTSATSASSASGGTIDFVCADGGVNTFFAPLVKGAQEAAKQMNVKMDFISLTVNTFDANGMNTAIQSALNTKPAALIYCDFFGDETDSSVSRAVSAGIPIFTVSSSPLPASIPTLSHYGVDWIDGGKIAGTAMHNAGVKIGLCANPNPTDPSFGQRCQGFTETMSSLGSTPKTLNMPSEAQNDTTLFESDLKGALVADPSVDGVFVQSPSEAVAAIQAVQEDGDTGKVKIVTVDLSTAVINDIKSGALTAALWQQPYMQGYMPVVAAANYITIGMGPVGEVGLGPTIVTKQNMHLFAAAFKSGDE